MQEPESNPLSIKVIKLLAENLGVESEDISEDDSFSEDLHMSPDKLADFVESLSALGFETSKLSLEEIETVGDFIEALSSHEDIK
jgi:acyl carrier protein